MDSRVHLNARGGRILVETAQRFLDSPGRPTTPGGNPMRETSKPGFS